MKNILVSPSGKLYGSEQVLLDYLTYTQHNFSIFVCGKDVLYRKLRMDFKSHRVFHFENVKILYFRLSILCLTRKVSRIYVNEAGHSKYVSLLARLFPYVKFIVHVRLIEDAGSDRWPHSAHSKNLIVLSVSQYLKNMLPGQSLQIYDPYRFRFNRMGRSVINKSELQVGIIGRISVTKGIDAIIKLLKLVEKEHLSGVIHFHFFGDVMPDVLQSDRYDQIRSFTHVSIRGFESDVERIFDTVDCVIHASGNETLGRIFLESIDFGKPFIGLNHGGTGEIGTLLQLTTLLVDQNDNDISDQLYNKLLFLRDNYETSVQQLLSKREMAAGIFSPVTYAQKIDSLIS